jgi:hypothetical protein
VAKEAKLDFMELEETKRAYGEKLLNPPKAPVYTAEQLRNKLALSKNAHGDYFVIDKDNEVQVNLLCMYFSSDPRLVDYNISHTKGILLMGGLGVGKSHLMSFFFQNQKASYVMAQCNVIESKWNTAKPEDPDVINYYSGHVNGASNPYGHQEIGFCFDDLGTETIPSKRFGEQKNVLNEIILNRYARKLDFNKTHITTNLNGDQIIELYGDRLNDRLQEMCNVIVFTSTRSRRK